MSSYLPCGWKERLACCGVLSLMTLCCPCFMIWDHFKKTTNVQSDNDRAQTDNLK